MRSTNIAAAVAIIVTGAAAAQPSETLDWPVGHMRPYLRDSGVVSNSGGAAAVTFREQIHLPEAVWIRVYFDRVELHVGSFVRISSQLDGEVQELDAAAMEMWANSSGYFNGDTVTVELMAAPWSTHNRVVITQVALETGAALPLGGGSGKCLCGGDDPRPVE